MTEWLLSPASSCQVSWGLNWRAFIIFTLNEYSLEALLHAARAFLETNPPLFSPRYSPHVEGWQGHTGLGPPDLTLPLFLSVTCFLFSPLGPLYFPCFWITLTTPSSNGQSNLCWRYHMYCDHRKLCRKEEKICLLHISPKNLSSRKWSYSSHGCIGHLSSLHHSVFKISCIYTTWKPQCPCIPLLILGLSQTCS